MSSPEWARSCWGSCPRCGRWGTRWGSWRVCRCCWACCTASTWSCCGALPGSWSSCARTLTPGQRSGAGGASSSFSGCSAGVSDWAIRANHIIYIHSWIQLCSLCSGHQQPAQEILQASCSGKQEYKWQYIQMTPTVTGTTSVTAHPSRRSPAPMQLAASTKCTSGRSWACRKTWTTPWRFSQVRDCTTFYSVHVK